MPNKTQEQIPSSGNLFEIYQIQVESVKELEDVVIKSKISQKTSKRILESTKVLMDCIEGIYKVLGKISELDTNLTENAKTNLQTLSSIILPIFQILDEINRLKLIHVIMSHIRIWRMGILMDHLKLLLLRISMIPPVLMAISIKVLNILSSATIQLTETINAISKMNFAKVWMAKRGIKRLYILLFGEPIKAGKYGKGLLDIFVKLGGKRYGKARMAMAAVVMKILVDTSKDLAQLITILGLILPLTVPAALTVRIINVVVKGLTRMFKQVGRKWKQILKGSIALRFMAGGLMVFMTAIILVGIAAVAGAKFIAAGILVVVGIITLFVLIGLLKKFIRRGYKTIKMIALAVAMLALVAITIALLGQFVTANWEGFLIVGTYMVLLLGVFFVIGLISKHLKRASKSIIIIALCMMAIAFTAILMAGLGQFIEANWEQMLIVGALMFTLVGLFWMIGKAQNKIKKGIPAIVVVVVGSLLMSIAIAILAKIADSTDMTNLLIVSGIMVGIILVIFGLMVALAAMASSGFGAVALDIGAAVMLAISAVMVSMGVALMAIAESVAIIDRLGIDDPKELAKKVMLPIEAAMVAVGALCMIPLPLIMIASANAVTLATVMISIGIIAKILQKIASLSIPDPAAGFDSKGNPKGYIQMTGDDFANAAMNANGILAVCAGMFDDSQNGNEVEFADGSKAKITTVSMNGIMAVTGQVKRKIRKLSKIMKYVGNIAVTLQKLSSLVVPDPAAGFDKDGNPKEYLIMQGQQFADACMNANGILMAASSMFATPNDDGSPIDVIFKGQDGEITAHIQPISLDALENIDGRVKRKIEKLGKIISVVGGMADTLQHISSLTIPDPKAGFNPETGAPLDYKVMGAEEFKQASEHTASILGYFAAIFDDESHTLKLFGQDYITEPLTLNGLENISRKMRKKVENLGKIINAVGGMANTIQFMANMRIPTAWDKSGNPTSFSPMKNPEDLEKSMENIKLIMTHIVDCMTSDDLANKLDNLSKRNSKKLANAMSSISGISSMADLISKLAGGQIPTKYTYDPETKQNIPGGFVNFSEYINNHKGDLRKNIENIYSIVTEAIINVCGSKEQIKRLEKVKTGMDLINKVMNPMFGMVKTATEVYTKVAELPEQTELSETMGRGTWMIRHTCWTLGDTKRILDEAGIPSLNTAKEYLTIIGDGKTGMLYRYKSMMEIYKNDFSSMDSNAFKERWSAATGTMESMFGIYNNSVKLDVINGIQKNITETISLVKTIGGVDTNKLKYAATLMASLNKVSQSIKGNFQGLAKVINEQLITALEKLQEVMKEIQTNGINVNSRPAVNPTAPGNNAGNGGSGLLDKIKDKFAGSNDNIQYPDEIVDKLDEILSIIEGFTDGYGNNRKVRTT